MTKNIINQILYISLLIFGLQNSIAANELKNVYAESEIVNEKIILSLNKQLFFAGEKINIGISTYDASTGADIDISSVVYVEIMSQNGEILQQQKANMKNGKCSMSINLSKNIGTDYYYIRAYTNYMQNFGEKAFAYSRIELINPFKNFFPTHSKTDNNQLEIYFENNHPIAHRKSKFAARCTSFDGTAFANKPIAIRNPNQATIATFTTDSLGCVSGELNIENAGNYTFYISENGNTIEQSVEVNENSKATFSVDRNDENFVIEIENRESDRTLNFVIFQNNVPLWSNTTEAENSKFEISKHNLPRGVIRMALMDGNDLICQTFIENAYDTKELNIENIAKSIANRTSVNAKILGNDVKISASVVDAQLTRQQLSNPDFIYFNRYVNYSDLLKSEQSEALRQFILYKSSALDQYIPIEENKYLPEFESDIISGTVINTNNNEPLANATIYAIVPDSVSYLSVTKTNENGKFWFVVDSVCTANEIVYEVPDTTNHCTIMSDNEFASTTPKFVTEDYLPDSKMFDLVQQQMINMQVEDAFWSINNNEIKPTLAFYGHESQIIYFDKFIKLPIMQEYIKELMPGVYIKKRHKHRYIRISNFAGQGFIGKNPLILINGIPVENHETMLALDPKRVEYVKLYNYRLYYKNMIFDGIFDLKTKENMDLSALVPMNCVVEDFICAQKNSNNQEINRDKISNRKPDFRSLLQYKFNIDLESEYNIHFNTSNIDGDYVLRIEGLSNDKTKIIRNEIPFSVK